MAKSGSDWLNAFFPESLWPPTDSDYYDKVIGGYNFIQDKKVIICGVCKNIEHNARNITAKIATIGEMFGSYSVFIYENDSTDATVKTLSDGLCSNNIPATLRSEKLDAAPHEQDKSLYRRQVMAQARNKYLEYVRSETADYVIIMDLDIKFGFSYQGITHSFSCPFNVVGSNGIIYETLEDGNKVRLFYDTWAYRENGEDLGDEANLLRFNRGEPLVPVESCFGGLAIYEKKWLDNVEYMDYDCDHVTLHDQIRANGGKVVLNPSQIVVYE